mgnify:CR=1 FL=1
MDASMSYETLIAAAGSVVIEPRGISMLPFLKDAGVVLDLAAQAVDVDHDGVVVHSDEVAPDLLVYHVLGEHLLRVVSWFAR